VKNCVHFYSGNTPDNFAFIILNNSHHNMRLVRLRKSPYSLILGIAAAVLLILGESDCFNTYNVHARVTVLALLRSDASSQDVQGLLDRYIKIHTNRVRTL